MARGAAALRADAGVAATQQMASSSSHTCGLTDCTSATGLPFGDVAVSAAYCASLRREPRIDA